MDNRQSAGSGKVPAAAPSAADVRGGGEDTEAEQELPDPAEVRVEGWGHETLHVHAAHEIATLNFRFTPDEFHELGANVEDWHHAHVEPSTGEQVPNRGRLLRWKLAQEVRAIDPRALRACQSDGLNLRGITVVIEFPAWEPDGHGGRRIVSDDTTLERYDEITWAIESFWRRIWESWPPTARPAFIVVRPDGAVALGAQPARLSGANAAPAAFSRVTGDEIVLTHAVLNLVVGILRAGGSFEDEQLALPIAYVPKQLTIGSSAIASRYINQLRQQGLLRRADSSVAYAPIRPRQKRPLQVHLSALEAAERAYWLDVHADYRLESEQHGSDYFRRGEFRDAAWYRGTRIDPTLRTVARWTKLVMRLRKLGVAVG